MNTNIAKKADDSLTTRKKLTNAALPLFLLHGFDGTGINQILKSANLSKGAFYHHFCAKSKIYEEVISNYFLTPLDQFNYDEISKLSLKQMRKAISDHYFTLSQQNSLIINIDSARYYAAYYEALSRLPNFKAKIENHYSTLIEMIATKTNIEREIFPKVATAYAKNIISAFEGKLILDVLISQDK